MTARRIQALLSAVLAIVAVIVVTAAPSDAVNHRPDPRSAATVAAPDARPTAAPHHARQARGDDRGPLGCDSRGDVNRADDCLRHRVVKSARDGVLRVQRTLVLRIGRQQPLRHRDLAVEVQVRKVHDDGHPGRWLTAQRALLRADTGPLTVRACTMNLAGRYEVRTKTTVGAGSGAARSSVTTTVTSGSTAFLAVQSAGQCVNSEADQTNVEFFNESQFNELFAITATPSTGSSSQWQLTLQCPSGMSQIAPTLAVSMGLVTGSTGTYGAVCSGGSSPSITVSSADAACSIVNQQLDCDLIVFGYNSVTQLIYTQTDVAITLSFPTSASGPAAPVELLPELNAATLPVCNNSLDPCLLSGRCSLSTQQEGVLTLCESATTCQNPTTPPGPGPYFTAA